MVREWLNRKHSIQIFIEKKNKYNYLHDDKVGKKLCTDTHDIYTYEKINKYVYICL